MKNKIYFFILTILVFLQTGFAANKILIVVETNCLQAISTWVNMYSTAIEDIDNKHCEVIDWTNPVGDMTYQCQPLRDLLQQKYFEARSAGDALEGAVLIGDVCVPLAYDSFYPDLYPMDHFFMDIVDRRPNPPVPYEIDTVPFNYTVYPPRGQTAFSGNYKRGAIGVGGDTTYDIWVSRINAAYMPTLREGWNIKDEYWIYIDYLQKVVNRMNNPATVPSRGFIMGGPEDLTQWAPLESTLGCLRNLSLPWFVEFDGPEQNSPFNWMSQLLAGPRGTMTYGSFNGALFPMIQSERNRRYCWYTLLNAFIYGSGTATPVSIAGNDSLGWEWAGLYNHSFPNGSNFWSGFDPGGNSYYTYNGSFNNATWGPSITLADRMTDGGYLGEYYRYYTDPDVENPYNMNMGTKGKMAFWRWRVKTGSPRTKNFDVYLSYVPSVLNDTHLFVNLQEATMNANGVPFKSVGPINNMFGVCYDQTNPQNDLLPQYRTKYPGCWHRVKLNTSPDTSIRYVTLHRDSIAIVSVDFCHDEVTPVYRIADAVLFISTDRTIDTAIDDSQPYLYPEQNDVSHQIFSTGGFAFSDYFNRNYEDMGTEPGGGGWSKSQFFMFCACEINNFTKNKNIGMMYALGHNGLINMGAAGPDDPNQVLRTPYIQALSNGMDFGQAYIYAVNVTSKWAPSYQYYNLFGAGTLHAQPYIQYGSDVVADQVITYDQTLFSSNPVLIRNVSVTGNVSWDVSSSNMPFGTHSEIVVRPETVFSPTGSDSVRLKAF
jgi:hypothetical protein